MLFTVREAELCDAELIADLSRQTFYDSFAPDNREEDMQLFLSTQFTREGLIAEVGRKDLRFLLAMYSDQVVGYVKLREESHPEFGTPLMEISRLYVLEKWIGKGVGKALMNASIATALDINCKCLWLGVWEKNRRAIEFYRKWGFEKFGETDFLLGKDLQRDWLMKKLL